MKNLEELLNKEIIKKIFVEKRENLGLSNSFEVQEIKQYFALAPETYILSIKIIDSGKERIFRGNASTIKDRKKSYEIFKILNPEFNEQYSIPQNFAYVENYNLLIYESIDGEMLTKQLNVNQDELIKKIKLSAKWLRKLHSLNLNIDLESYSHFDDDKNLDKIKSSKKILIHGDYQTNNIIIKDDKIWVIDFNDSAIDNPMIDIASFLSQLKTMLLRFSDVAKFPILEKAFLESYQENNSLSDDEKSDIKVYQKKYFEKIHKSLSASLEFFKDPRKGEILLAVQKYYEEI